MVMATPAQSALNSSPTIKCATCSRPLAFDELETHVCPKPSSSTPPSPRASAPSRTPSPSGSLSPRGSSVQGGGDPRLRGASSPTPPIRRTVSPLVPSRTQQAQPQSPPRRSPQPPPQLKRSVTENIHVDQLHGRPTENTQPSPASPRRSVTMPRMRSDSSASSRPFVIDAYTPDPSRQSSYVPGNDGSSTVGGHHGGRDTQVPILSLHIPDTESGGSAGRAGVGRRAFAAVAQAALLATSYSNSYHDYGQPPLSPSSPHSPHQPQQYGSPPNPSSQYLDINGRGMFLLHSSLDHSFNPAFLPFLIFIHVLFFLFIIDITYLRSATKRYTCTFHTTFVSFAWISRPENSFTRFRPFRRTKNCQFYLFIGCPTWLCTRWSIKITHGTR